MFDCRGNFSENGNLKQNLPLSFLTPPLPSLIMSSKKAHALEVLFVCLDYMGNIMHYGSVFGIRSNLDLILLSSWVGI